MSPIYVHRCATIGCRAKAVEATYSMSHVGAEETLPAELRRTITCNPDTCRHPNVKKGLPVPVPSGTWHMISRRSASRRCAPM